jgi:hypothetical protein
VKFWMWFKFKYTSKIVYVLDSSTRGLSLNRPLKIFFFIIR